MRNIQEVRRALSHIPARDRVTWVNMGMAIKSELGEVGFSVFDEWSQSADNYSQRDAVSVWKSFKGHGITNKSLFKLARENGWQSNVKIDLPIMAEVKAPKENRDLNKYAKSIWVMANFDDRYIGTHPYSMQKQVKHAFGAGRGKSSGSIIGQEQDCIIIPIRKYGIGEVQAVQCINSNGKKQTFGSMTGGYLLLGNEADTHANWWVVEGWATGYSMQMIERNAVTCISFGLSRLESVANMIAKIFNPNQLVILKDATDD